ncbi:DUF5926 family protein [Arcanobacterium hippocoleae]|uniref:DUF5926 family protein n=1 Tax=Arcanobacterium hippocoleae TaxID=149017 RepID=UPI0033419A14
MERPFAGIPFEAELVAMREILAAGTLTVKTNAENGAADVMLVSMLPQMVGALRRSDGKLLVALQTVMNSGDLSLDVADRLLHALELKNGETYTQTEQPEPGKRLQDVLDLAADTEFTLHDDFGFWIGADEAEKSDVQQAIAQTKEQLFPTAEVAGVPGAFWTKMQREFLRLVRREDQDTVLNALARLQQRRELNFDLARFVGAFRAQGLLIPVFELDPGTTAADLEIPLAKFTEILAGEITNTAPLTPEERRAKAGIVSRQVTLR